MFERDRWINRRWQSESRYYTVEILQDLFGEWSLRASWGGLGGRRGNIQVKHMPNYASAIAAMNQITKRRQVRGYQLIY